MGTAFEKKFDLKSFVTQGSVSEQLMRFTLYTMILFDIIKIRGVYGLIPVSHNVGR